MEQFLYTAVDKDGNEKRGQVEALTLNDAVAKIRQMDFFPVDVSALRDKKGSNFLAVLFANLLSMRLGTGKVKPQDLVIFTRQLSVLLDAGLPLVRGLHTLRKQSRFETMSAKINDIIGLIESGKPFSDALANYPESFSKVYVNIVKAGESGGALDQVLRRLADYLERNLKLAQRIQSALIYPALVMVISVGILGFIIVFVIPRFMQLFQDTGIALPLLTRMLLGLSNFFLTHWYLVIIGIIFIGVSYKMLLRNYTFRCANDRLKLRIPVVGQLNQKIIAARFARTLSTLLGGGVPILRALELTKEVSGNEIIAMAVASVHDNVREGGFISRVLEKTDVFPPLMINMIAIGEESGALDKMLSKVADTYEEEVEITTNTLTTLLEPLLVIIMGIVVGIIVLSMFFPLIALIQTLTN
ncbi:MAG: type II secretion system F family protein [Candidatus Omnitrophica bacterium]|nr:type II secretion system F family protein [Candidatus Omnitrophota bacterium]MBU4479360.1 type II secretion system F family protein [Candidatus Omnitrophota bacterium]MCG2703836.1 type II secretion system F family protein [Candidatus Omnitrophota bacterium]